MIKVAIKDVEFGTRDEGIRLFLIDTHSHADLDVNSA